MTLIPNLTYSQFEAIKGGVAFNADVVAFTQEYLSSVWGWTDPVTVGFVAQSVPHVYNPTAFRELGLHKPSPAADRAQAKARVKVPAQVKTAIGKLSMALAETQLQHGPVMTPGGVVDASKARKLARYIRNRLDVAMRAHFSEFNRFCE
jgi:hypothetical protein